MIQNLIFDIGGVLFDDSTENINQIFHIDSTELCKRVYGESFKDCVLGKVEVSDYIKGFQNDPDYQIIQYILDKKNLSISFPLLKENYEYISNLKEKYHLYILSNISKDSYEYVRETIPVDEVFLGGVYSYQEGLIKPDPKIFEIIMERYHLKKEETLFFDDRKKNVEAACDFGIKGILFQSIKDVENSLSEK